MTDQYKQVAPAGLAPEVTADNGATREQTLRFGAWLAGVLGDNAALKTRVATLSGLSGDALSQLLSGQPTFGLDNDHVQRLATALVETGTVTDSSAVWEAAGMGQSDYIVPPARIVDAMSQG